MDRRTDDRNPSRWLIAARVAGGILIASAGLVFVMQNSPTWLGIGQILVGVYILLDAVRSEVRRRRIAASESRPSRER